MSNYTVLLSYQRLLLNRFSFENKLWVVECSWNQSRYIFSCYQMFKCRLRFESMHNASQCILSAWHVTDMWARGKYTQGSRKDAKLIVKSKKIKIRKEVSDCDPPLCCHTFSINLWTCQKCVRAANMDWQSALMLNIRAQAATWGNYSAFLSWDALAYARPWKSRSHREPGFDRSPKIPALEYGEYAWRGPAGNTHTIGSSKIHTTHAHTLYSFPLSGTQKTQGSLYAALYTSLVIISLSCTYCTHTRHIHSHAWTRKALNVTFTQNKSSFSHPTLLQHTHTHALLTATI